MKKQKYLESKSLSMVLFGFLFLLYAIVFMTKNMFSSALAIIVEEGIMTKSQTGLITAAFWLVYAVFQVVGGFAADKYSPYKLIMIGMLGSVVCNMVIWLDQSYPVIMTAWMMNAMVQFGLWPGIFKILSTQLAPSLRKTAVFWILFSTSLGLGFSMLIASYVGHWKDNFLVSAISLLVMAVVYTALHFFIDKRMIEKEVVLDQGSVKSNVEKAPMLPLLFSSGLGVLLIVTFLKTAVDNGIKMMTPVMLMESYQELPGAIATRISAVLIIFSAIGTLSAAVVQRKMTNNEVKAQIIFYGATFLPLLVVCLVGRIHYLWILTALSVVILMQSGASPFCQTYMALRFESYGRIGTAVGVSNATAALGNIFASYVFARMAELMPWSGIAISWLLASGLCIVLCLGVLPRWTKFTQKN